MSHSSRARHGLDPALWWALVWAAVATVVVGSAAVAGAVGEGEAAYLERTADGRYVATLDDDGRTRVVADINAITPPAISPAFDRVAFSGAIGDESLGLYAIFVVNMDGSGLTQVTAAEYGEFDPVWVDDGDTIVFSQNTSGSITGDCCRLAQVDVATSQIDPLTSNIGAQRPTAVPNGSHIYFDDGDDVWRIPVSGGTPEMIVTSGYDPAISDDEGTLAFLRGTGSGETEIRTVASSGGSSTVLHTTANVIENPVWIDDRIYFIEHDGLGYDGRKSVALQSVAAGGGSVLTELSYPDSVVGATPGTFAEEILFYRATGDYGYYPPRANATLGPPIQSGSDYTAGWSSITSVNLDGDGDDEILFYRGDGLYRYYDIGVFASVGSPIRAGEDYTSGWDSISAVDLDGDGQDEMFFYRADGLYRYYNIRSNGRIGAPITAGEDYTAGWDSISAVDLDGDGQDEMFFYRADGLYRYYNIHPNGRIGAPIVAGDDYDLNWDAITAIDIDGDGQDEMFFYRADGLYRYYDVSSGGVLSSLILTGTDYQAGWSSISSIELPDG